MQQRDLILVNLHQSVRALVLQDISRAGHDSYFMRGVRVFQIPGSVLVATILEGSQIAAACRSHSSSGVLFLNGLAVHHVATDEQCMLGSDPRVLVWGLVPVSALGGGGQLCCGWTSLGEGGS